MLDIGTSTTKCGFAGEDSPKFVVPSSVGVVGGEEGASSDGATRLVGTSALGVRRDGMRVESALTDGIVTNWDAAEALISHAYKSCLCTSAAEHPVLMAEPSFNTPAAREKMAELLFEQFSAPALFLSKATNASSPPPLSLALPSPLPPPLSPLLLPSARASLFAAALSPRCPSPLLCSTRPAASPRLAASSHRRLPPPRRKRRRCSPPSPPGGGRPSSSTWVAARQPPPPSSSSPASCSSYEIGLLS